MPFVEEGDDNGTNNGGNSGGGPNSGGVVLPGPSHPMIRLSPVAKAVVAFIGGLVAFVIGLLSDDTFSQQDFGLLVVWILQTFGVYRVPNKE